MEIEELKAIYAKKSSNRRCIHLMAGREFTLRVRAAAAASPEKTRNDWMTKAIIWYLEQDSPLKTRMSAHELLADRVLLVMTISPLLVEMMNDICRERYCARNTWLIDACAGYMEYCGD